MRFKSNLMGLVLLFVLTTSSFPSPTIRYESSEEIKDKVVIYFYSPTCSSCMEVENYFNEIIDEENINILKYNVASREGKLLFNAYCKQYNVPNQKQYVPILFISDTYLLGDMKIKKKMLEVLSREDSVQTQILLGADTDFSKDKETFNKYKFTGVFISGLVNGVNPCSVAMFIFLVSILKSDKQKIKIISLTFIVGKFITFFLLGSILYNLLSIANFRIVGSLVKGGSLLIVVVLVICNILDAMALKNDRYNKVKLQLPLKVRKLNHKLMRKVETSLEKNLIPVVLLVSVLVSLGEFLCTGQIYLMTIVTAIQYIPTAKLSATVLLFIYNIALVLPLIALTVAVYYGKKVFDISEFVRERMYLVKIINTVVLILMGTLLVLV